MAELDWYAYIARIEREIALCGAEDFDKILLLQSEIENLQQCDDCIDISDLDTALNRLGRRDAICKLQELQRELLSATMKKQDADDNMIDIER